MHKIKYICQSCKKEISLSQKDIYSCTECGHKILNQVRLTKNNNLPKNNLPKNNFSA